jgi:hypothetical protein
MMEYRRRPRWSWSWRRGVHCGLDEAGERETDREAAERAWTAVVDSGNNYYGDQ